MLMLGDSKFVLSRLQVLKLKHLDIGFYWAHLLVQLTMVA